MTYLASEDRIMKSVQRIRGIGLAVAGLAVVLSASSCAKTKTNDIKVHSAADAKTDFKGYQTYAWYGAMSAMRDDTGMWIPRDRDALAEMKFLVDKKMREMGLSESSESPDLLVSMLIVGDVQEMQKIQSERAQSIDHFEPVGEGALVIELIDGDTGKTVWLGDAVGQARQSYSLKQSNERLSYAVDKLFDELPR
jgi:hypothetical protein